ncbi:helix-turn-helix domain-containing protein [Psychrobacter celer]
MTTPRQTVTATQTDTIRAHLMTGATISTWEAYERYQITCLAQRIHDLRNDGMNIQSKPITKNGKRFSLYWIEQEERARYVSGQVNTPVNVRGTGSDTDNQDEGILASINEATKGHRAKHDALAAVNADDGVWLPYDYIDNLLSALTNNAKALNLLAQITNIEGGTEADKINDCSMDVLDIAMSLTMTTNNIKPRPGSTEVSGTWLAHDYLKQIKQSIDGNTNNLGTMIIMAKLANTDLSDGVNRASMRLTEISAIIGELIENE